jgi:serine-type D-Ala-D-Ala carboxypeptidase (penicillin-binding protein 5/6)
MAALGSATVKAIAALAVIAVAAAGAVQAQGANQGPSEFVSKARNAIVMDADSGAIMYQVKADELIAPASMSKLMTLAVVFRALKAGQIKLDDQFLMSENAWRRGGAPSRTSAMMVPLNTRVKLDELLQGIIVQSGNDAAIAVAEGLAGNEAAFAKTMIEEARRIGLKKSEFRNATGLSHPEHVMTARELAILARHLIKEYPEYYPRFAQREFNYSKHRFINRNSLLSANIGADGLKTGHLAEAGYGLVGSATQDGKRLVVVIAGLATDNDRKEEGRKIFEWGFKNFTEFKIFDAGEVVGHARVWGGGQLYVGLKGKGDVSVILPRFPANQKLKGEIVYQGPLKPPIKAGAQIAVLRVTSSSGASNDIALFAAEDVQPAGMVRRGLDSLAHLAEQAVGLAFAKIKPSSAHSQQ